MALTDMKKASNSRYVKQSVKHKCQDCEQVFYGLARAIRCPDCVFKRKRRKIKIERECLFCRKPYKATHDTRKFCSNSCREKYRRKEQAEIKYCKVCGKEIGKLTPKEYCSKECMRKWQKENPRWTKTCLTCGSEFNTNYKKQNYCSHKCGVDSLRSMKTFACKNCNKDFTPKANNRTTFCSRECGFEYKTKNKKAIGAKEKKVYKLKCAVCRAEFESYRKIAVYCSGECSKAKAKKAIRRKQETSEVNK